MGGSLSTVSVFVTLFSRLRPPFCTGPDVWFGLVQVRGTRVVPVTWVIPPPSNLPSLLGSFCTLEGVGEFAASS